MIFIKKAFYFFALLPFISPVPLHTDVQPVSMLLAASIFIVDVLYKRVNLNRFEVYFLLFSIVSFVIVGSSGTFELRHRIGLLFAFLIYYTVKNYYYYLDSKVIKSVIAIHFIGVVWHYLSPSSFIPFAEIFVRTIKGTVFTSRGASGFAPESSFAAVLSMVHILILVFLHKSNRISNRSTVILTLLSLSVIILSQSGAGYVYGAVLLAVGIVFISNNWVKVFTVGCMLIIIPLFLNSNIASNRGGTLFRILVENPRYIFIDGSITERWVGLHIGYKSFSHYPFGLGGGTYATSALEMTSKYDLESLYPLARPPSFVNTVSAAARYTTEFGLFFLMFYLWIIIKSFDLRIFPVLSSILGFLLIFTSFSITFPPTYVLFAMAFIDKRIYRANKYYVYTD